MQLVDRRPLAHLVGDLDALAPPPPALVVSGLRPVASRDGVLEEAIRRQFRRDAKCERATGP